MDNKPQQQKITILTKEGKPFQVPAEGSLGLLALGYKGLIAWRQARRQLQKTRKEQAQKNETLNPDNILDNENN